MSSFIISTDSTCDLPYEFIKENDVLIQPLQYTTGDQIFHDGPTTDLKKFYDNMEPQLSALEGKVLTTGLPGGPNEMPTS